MQVRTDATQTTMQVRTDATHSVVATQCCLEAATQCESVDGSHHRHRHAFKAEEVSDWAAHWFARRASVAKR